MGRENLPALLVAENFREVVGFDHEITTSAPPRATQAEYHGKANPHGNAPCRSKCGAQRHAHPDTDR
jgi:hypothetical protein